MSVTGIIVAGVLMLSAEPEAHRDFDAIMSFLKSRDACIEALEADLGRRPLAHDESASIEKFVSAVFDALPAAMQRAFAEAASAAGDGLKPRDERADDRRARLLALRARVRDAFAAQLHPALDGCGDIALEFVPNLVYRRHVMNSPSVTRRLEAAGLHDQDAMQRALLLALLAQASGETWQLTWFVPGDE
ncbi:hypothetical protein ACQQ2N_06340 [Dokdonella sp. MW10]|uniref:hypothetical protein n=1 Tax=Dokdonella sp. MW10 TaxID=2992926 RepID=UPI003F802F2B